MHAIKFKALPRPAPLHAPPLTLLPPCLCSSAAGADHDPLDILVLMQVRPPW